MLDMTNECNGNSLNSNNLMYSDHIDNIPFITLFIRLTLNQFFHYQHFITNMMWQRDFKILIKLNLEMFILNLVIRKIASVVGAVMVEIVMKFDFH